MPYRLYYHHMSTTEKFEALYRAQNRKLAKQWQAKADKARRTGKKVTGYTPDPLTAEDLERFAKEVVS